MKKNCLSLKYPKLVKEWHPAKNKDLTPYDVLPSSKKVVWWKCYYGHEWQSRIFQRKRNPECPHCVRELRKKNTPD